MHRDYLVFWCIPELKQSRAPRVIRVVHPPCEEQKGGALDELILASLPKGARWAAVIEGAVQLPHAHASVGTSLTIALGNGQVGSVECSDGAWRVHV